MSPSVENLASRVGWEDRGVEGVDWRYVESRLGVVLPSDYKALVESFPCGGFRGFLHVLQPCSAEQVDRYIDLVLESAAAVQSPIPEMSELPYDIYPAVPGFFPWGRIEGEHMLCWHFTSRADPAPRSYLVNIEFGRCVGLEGSMIECILEAVTGRTRVVADLLSDSEPGFVVYR